MHEILENLKKAVLEYDDVSAEIWARKSIEEGHISNRKTGPTSVSGSATNA